MLGLCAFFALGLASCPSVPKRNPSGVRDLGAADVDVTLALGDSITAGFGMMGWKGPINEYRGQSWSIGGDANATTLPNFFQQYNPNVTGASRGTHLANICWGPLCPPFQHKYWVDHLNAAQSGALIKNVARDQVDYLVTEMKRLEIDVDNSWKHLTLLIGANDLCLYCTQKRILSATEWEDKLREILSQIAQRIPRVAVSVLELFNVSQVYELGLKETYCKDIHTLAFLECTCAFDPIDGKRTRQVMDEAATEYNRRTRSVVREFNDPRNDTFAVVAQQFLEDLRVEDQPLKFISQLDCFHPSLVGHQVFATNMWNALWEPVGNKSRVLNPNPKPYCPTSEDRIQTLAP